MTVFKKVQLALRNPGYCPTTNMIQDASTALSSFAFLLSHSFNNILRIAIKNPLSSLSGRCPDSAPTAQERLLTISYLNYPPSSWVYILLMIRFFNPNQSIFIM